MRGLLIRGCQFNLPGGANSDLCSAQAHVRFGPEADISSSIWSPRRHEPRRSIRGSISVAPTKTPAFVPKGRYWTTVQWRKKNERQQYVHKVELAMERNMLSRAEEYRQRARDCEQAAQETIDAGMKALFQELSNRWRHMASEAELPDQKEKMQ